MDDKQRIVFTGGPCCGKTTILENLALNGLTVVAETARIVIEEEQKKDSECLPWRNLYLFQERVARVQMEREHSYDDRLLFLDRGIIDGHAFSLNGKIATPRIITQTGANRYNLVLLLDPVKNYKNDHSRRESKEVALSIHKHIKIAYNNFGYNPLSVPIMEDDNFQNAIAKRADYVIKLLEGKVI